MDLNCYHSKPLFLVRGVIIVFIINAMERETERERGGEGGGDGDRCDGITKQREGETETIKLAKRRKQAEGQTKTDKQAQEQTETKIFLQIERQDWSTDSKNSVLSP